MHQGGDLAIVLTGGGARAAYQVGMLRCLGRAVPELRFPIITGVSAGAINATYLAAHPGPLGESAPTLSELWAKLEVEDIFRTDVPWLARNLVRWATHLVSGGNPRAPEVRGLVDTQPLRHTIERSVATVDGEVIGVARNVERGLLKALALTTLNYSTGQTITWTHGGGSLAAWQRPRRVSQPARIGVEHVMASSALPLFFPAVRLGESWYGDGGVRLQTPLAPALHLGARRILAVSPRYQPTREEAERRKVRGYPPPAQILNHLLNSIFLDMLDYDSAQMERLNFLLQKLPPEERGDLAPVELLVLRPSVDIGALARDFEPHLPLAFRYLTRSLGTRETKSGDFLSYLSFDPDYLTRLMEIGEADAEARLPEIRALLGA
ncbi:MAG TPA: patatin-like phospholipase family protein [Thermoanaerobaculia bacterium]|nr:patatin-like phospholipase family protein [Thermoanaerobaculia bacterium]